MALSLILTLSIHISFFIISNLHLIQLQLEPAHFLAKLFMIFLLLFTILFLMNWESRPIDTNLSRLFGPDDIGGFCLQILWFEFERTRSLFFFRVNYSYSEIYLIEVVVILWNSVFLFFFLGRFLAILVCTLLIKELFIYLLIAPTNEISPLLTKNRLLLWEKFTRFGGHQYICLAQQLGAGAKNWD